MKVCHIISGDLWAGAEVMAFSLIQELYRYESLDLKILLLNMGRLSEELYEIGIPISILDETKLPFNRIISNGRAFIRKFSPHIIHSHRYKENILALIVRGLEKSSRLVATQHGMPLEKFERLYSKPNLVARINRYILCNLFDHIVAVSNDIKLNYLNKQGFLPKKRSAL